MQVLFVLKDHRIAFWKFQRGRFVRGSLQGNDWSDYTSAYWNDWSEVNQSGDTVDAILLSDRPNGYGKLPPWFNGSDAQANKWTMETFSKMLNDDEFAGKGVVIYLGAKRYIFASGSPEETFWIHFREENLCSQFGVAKEKQLDEALQRAAAETREKMRAAEKERKCEAELLRKRTIEEGVKRATAKAAKEAEAKCVAEVCELERQRKIEADRKAEEERRIAEMIRLRKELRRVKEEARKNVGYKAFGADVVRVVKELSLFERDRITCSELNLLREGLLDEGFGVIADLVTMEDQLSSDEVFARIRDSEVKMSMECFEEKSRFLCSSQIKMENWLAD